MSQSTETLPLTGAQRALLGESASEGAPAAEAAAYRVALLEAGAPLDPARLERALTAVVRREDVFRARFVSVPGYKLARQTFAREALPIQWRVIELSQDVAPELALQRCVHMLATAPLDTVKPELRAELFCSVGVARALVLAVPRLCVDRAGLHLLCSALLQEYLEGAPAMDQSGTSYEQFVRWCEDLELGEEGTSGVAYWREYVASPGGGALRLPGRRAGALAEPRAATWGCASRPVASQLSDGLRALAEREQSSLEAVVQAAWWALVARIGGREDFMAGWLHDCRDDYDAVAYTVGVFERLFPVRVRVLAGESFLQWHTRFATTTGQHRDWQESWPLADWDRAALGTVVFALERQRTKESGAEPLLRLRAGPLQLAGSELVASAVLAPDGALRELRISHALACYDPAVAERLVTQLHQLLSSIVAAPLAPLSELTLTSDEERRALLSLNDTALSGEPVPLPQRVSEWAARTPGAPALESGGVSISYAELQLRASQLSRWLSEQGVQPEERVALLLPRSAATIIAVLGVLGAGAAYVPIEPRAPWARTRRVLEDAQPRLVLCEREWLGERDPAELRELGLRWLALEELAPELARQPSSPPAVELTPSGAAYVMYTSGSTGQPKGVVVEHAQLGSYAAAVSQELGLASRRRFAVVSTLAADLGHTTLYGGLFNGGCLVLASDEDLSDGQNFARFLRERQIDCLKIVPSHLEALLVSETRQLPDTLVLGGEPTPLDLLERLLSIAPSCQVFNHYGPTETTVGVMVHAVRSLEEERSSTSSGKLPLTRVLPGCRVYLLDAAQRLVPTGQVGELYVGGAQVCRGYVSGGQEPRFVPDPLRPGERLYRTGDLGRYRAHGGIDLLGRADDQIKISGFRIEPGEVEAVLRALPGVHAGAVLVDRAAAVPRLVAYVAADDADDPAVAQTIAAGLRESLPDAMVPREVVVLTQLPRLPNGKIDRQSLSRMAPRSPGGGRPAAPASALEADILSCMRRVLARDDIGPADSFFELGGNSLLAIKLVSRLRESLQVEVPLNAVFDHPSPMQLAQVLEQLGGKAR